MCGPAPVPTMEIVAHQTGGSVRRGGSAWAVVLASAWAILASGAVAAGQQQASFAVAVTLHRVVKPLSAAELCKDGQPIRTLGATIRIDCPRPADSATAPGREAALTGGKLPRPEVTVTF